MTKSASLLWILLPLSLLLNTEKSVADDSVQTVVKVVHAKGNFDQVGNKKWKETLGNKTGYFKEYSRDSSVINLLKDNGVRVEINLKEGKIYYGGSPSAASFIDPAIKKELYTITDRKSVTRKAVSSGSNAYLETIGNYQKLGDDTYLGQSYSGVEYYYPIPRTADKAEKLIVSLISGTGNIKENSSISLKATATGDWDSGWGSYNLLGAFEGGIYYWKDYGEKTTWTITKAFPDSTDPTIYYGDVVFLKNPAFTNGYLELKVGEINSTSVGQGWYILEKTSPWWTH
jgi:hypothetical protein